MTSVHFLLIYFILSYLSRHFNSAAGRIFIDGTWYEQLGANAKFEPITENTRAIEKIITGMRTMRGVLLAKDVKNVLNMEYATTHPELVTIDCDRIRATEKGLLILDDLVMHLVN